MTKSLDVLTLGSVVVLIALVVSGIAPFDRTTWWMEVAPVLIGFPVLWLMRRGRNYFEFTRLVYVLICVHALVLILGGAYSMSKHYKKMVEQARREGAQQAKGQGCTDAHAESSAEACGSKPADHNPEKGQGGGQC